MLQEAISTLGEWVVVGVACCLTALPIACLVSTRFAHCAAAWLDAYVSARKAMSKRYTAEIKKRRVDRRSEDETDLKQSTQPVVQ